MAYVESTDSHSINTIVVKSYAGCGKTHHIMNTANKHDIIITISNREKVRYIDAGFTCVFNYQQLLSYNNYEFIRQQLSN